MIIMSNDNNDEDAGIDEKYGNDVMITVEILIMITMMMMVVVAVTMW